MFETVEAYLDTAATLSLTEVKFIIYKQDHDTLQVVEILVVIY